MTNREFSSTDEGFRRACERAGIQPTARQASKFRLGFGRAWQSRLPDREKLDSHEENGIH